LGIHEAVVIEAEHRSCVGVRRTGVRASSLSLPRSRRARVVEITAAAVDRRRVEPIYQQLVRFLRSAIVSGRIAPGATLPPTRQLARQLSVSRATVVSVYEILLSEGLVVTTVGSGTVVQTMTGAWGEPDQRARFRPSPASTQPTRSRGGQTGVLEPRRPPTDHIQASLWRRLVAERSLDGVPALAGAQTGDFWRLRENIATYLLLSRGLRCAPEQVFVASSVQQALTLIARIARDDAITFHFEPLSSERARRAFENQGANVGTLAGFFHEAPSRTVERLTNGGIFVMPGCHYPLGMTLRQDAREALAHALNKMGLWAIEDARDFEFLDADTVPTLYELRSGRQTFHIGALSTVLLPFVRLAYVVAPESIVRRLLDERLLADDDIPSGIQAAAAEMLETGMFHSVARSARQVAQRRRTLFHECARRHPVWTLPAPEARRGLHSLLWVDTRDKLVDLRNEIGALDAGVEIAVSSAARRMNGAGLVMGFADVRDDVMGHYVARVAATVERAIESR
jgi:GntR family transcriptional regulator / MocR family aminotransferase